MIDFLDLVWLLATEPIRWLFKPVTRWRDRQDEERRRSSALVWERRDRYL